MGMTITPIEELEETRAKFDIACEQAQRGELMSEDEFLEERKAKKAAWLARYQSA